MELTKQELLEQICGRKKPIFYNDEILNSAVCLSLAATNEKTVWKTVAANRFSNKTIFDNSLSISGASLAEHLDGCKKAALFCVTLGDDFDRLIEKTKYENLELAYLIDQCGLILVEKLCDKTQSDIYDANGKKITARFSIGFDDTKLAEQQDFLNFLNAPKLIGVSTTKGDMMRPTKSVTGVIGIYD